MSVPTPGTSELHALLGYRRLNPAWAKAEILLGLFAASCGSLGPPERPRRAKAEILLGLFAAGLGLLLGQLGLGRGGADLDLVLAAGGLALFVLGGYLALAGHRSHLYRSLNDRTALLLEELRRIRGEHSEPRHP